MVGMVGIWAVFAMLVLSIAYIAERVLFALATYNDALAKSNRNAVMWGLLVGFLGLIPGIIYICIRSSNRNFIVCPNCGCSHYLGDLNCPRCGAPNPSPQWVNPFAAQQAHKAKVQLTIAIVLICIGIVAGVIAGSLFVATVCSYTGSSICY